MITVKYRLVGHEDAQALTKTFQTRKEADSWIKAQVNVLVLEIESSGAEALNRIFG